MGWLDVDLDVSTSFSFVLISKTVLLEIGDVDGYDFKHLFSLLWANERHSLGTEIVQRTPRIPRARENNEPFDRSLSVDIGMRLVGSS